MDKTQLTERSTEELENDFDLVTDVGRRVRVRPRASSHLITLGSFVSDTDKLAQLVRPTLSQRNGGSFEPSFRVSESGIASAADVNNLPSAFEVAPSQTYSMKGRSTE